MTEPRLGRQISEQLAPFMPYNHPPRRRGAIASRMQIPPRQLWSIHSHGLYRVSEDEAPRQRVQGSTSSSSLCFHSNASRAGALAHPAPHSQLPSLSHACIASGTLERPPASCEPIQCERAAQVPALAEVNPGENRNTTLLLPLVALSGLLTPFLASYTPFYDGAAGGSTISGATAAATAPAATSQLPNVANPASFILLDQVASRR
ncbi:hypothetical protein TARUN_7840 [Trichoderma arundinaceum]|uniref:Uncharacterized protein n=1 Tax=Trichoderma arundinaceum TaxID=490622 RepID=A0A395NEG7_TRIAR|nr:hypothetical protein TARUN_7840 [Trichoderma arundinaceum]